MHHLRRRLLLLGSGALLAPRVVLAQPKPARIARIGWLGTGFAGSARALETFKQRLKELNHVEGRDVAIEVVSADGDQAKFVAAAKDLARRNVEVFVAGGTLGAKAMQSVTSTIPIVAAGASDLAEAGLVASNAKPGNNITGISVNHPEAASKQLETIKELVPQGRRVAVLWPGPRTPFLERQRKELEANAVPRFELTWHTVLGRSDLGPAFDAIQIFRPDFLVVLTDNVSYTNRKELAGQAAKARIPAIYGFREFVDEGGLMSYGANILQSFRVAADYVDRILKGARPADIPVQMPTKYELAVNIGAARALGLRFPQAMLARADIVVP